jgi:hypothetical protein
LVIIKCSFRPLYAGLQLVGYGQTAGIIRGFGDPVARGQSGNAPAQIVICFA